ncbi:hypothetical protein OFO01_05990 [Campylobacter sp. JMF_01 NE2]|uniref:hypothetical protein n=1 Tax=unclassified Campylobacter TaxID=2593542 RepID=UPI0022EA0CF2|nr:MULTISPECIES: hypothetical protein [unclassified Campylobacter]MDA3053004.1 hypothetical protein [Campylobacter sp. JMF_03 NE3]MDA3067335.1 hypothetical protein [Campylobacter sp. JMF_01 NE2]
MRILINEFPGDGCPQTKAFDAKEIFLNTAKDDENPGNFVVSVYVQNQETALFSCAKTPAFEELQKNFKSMIFKKGVLVIDIQLNYLNGKMVLKSSSFCEV